MPNRWGVMEQGSRVMELEWVNNTGMRCRPHPAWASRKELVTRESVRNFAGH